MNPADVLLQTTRLELRAPKKSDLELLQSIFQERAMMQYLGEPSSGAQVRERLDAWISSWGGGKAWCGIVRTRAARESIGTASLHRSPIAAEPGLALSFMILPVHQRQGFAKEIAAALVSYAFEHMGAERVLIDAHPANENSHRIARALGFSCIGERFFEHAGLYGERRHVVWELKRPEGA